MGVHQVDHQTDLFLEPLEVLDTVPIIPNLWTVARIQLLDYLGNGCAKHIDSVTQP